MRKLIPCLALMVMALLSAICINSCKKNSTTVAVVNNEPAISGFSPAADTIGGTVTITGTNFSPVAADNIVEFNGVVALVSSASATELVVIIPAISAAGAITVTVNDQTAVSNKNFIPILKPVISTITPIVAGTGYPVVLTGLRFGADTNSNIVRVNGVVARVLEASAIQLSIIIPEGATAGKVSVTAGGVTGFSMDSMLVKELTVTTLAGIGAAGSADGPGNMASFSSPAGIVADANGNLFIADRYNSKIREITPDGTVSTYAGTGINMGQSPDIDGPRDSATISAPYAIIIDKDGNLIISENNNNEIRKISPDGIVSTISGPFSTPLGLALDSSGNLFEVDGGTASIQEITPQGVVTTLAGNAGIFGSRDGVGTSASFDNPLGITYGADGNFYVTEPTDYKIRKITPAGVVTTIAGTGAPGSADGQGTAASFVEPAFLVSDPAGNIYLTDSYNANIRLIAPGGFVGTVAGKVGPSYAPTDGVGRAAAFGDPSGIAMDKNGNLYVVDTGSNKIRKITVR